jgi:hypothetical protein
MYIGILLILLAITAGVFSATQPHIAKKLDSRGQTTIAVGGIVTDADSGKGLPHAAIKVGQEQRDLTDDTGNFRILFPAAYANTRITLKVTVAGYPSIERTITAPIENVEIALRK